MYPINRITQIGQASSSPKIFYTSTGQSLATFEMQAPLDYASQLQPQIFKVFVEDDQLSQYVETFVYDKGLVFVEGQLESIRNPLDGLRENWIIVSKDRGTIYIVHSRVT